MADPEHEVDLAKKSPEFRIERHPTPLMDTG
jgi:hypothetical protein